MSEEILEVKLEITKADKVLFEVALLKSWAAGGNNLSNVTEINGFERLVGIFQARTYRFRKLEQFSLTQRSAEFHEKVWFSVIISGVDVLQSTRLIELQSSERDGSVLCSYTTDRHLSVSFGSRANCEEMAAVLGMKQLNRLKCP
nr:hypothetical protein Iba_chr01cCG10550 [Ipomoea batatas]